MKCPNCKSEMNVQIATKVKTDNCRILSSMTAILTIQCGECEIIFQLPIQGNGVVNTKDSKQ